MSVYKSGSKSFTITKTNLLALDTAALNLYSFTVPSDASTRRIFVPTALKLRYKAGNAGLTITRPSDGTRTGLAKDDYKYPEYSLASPDYKPYDTFLHFYFNRDEDNYSSATIGRKVFSVSVRDLGLLGTTDSAVIALPFNDGQVFDDDNTAFMVRGDGSTFTGFGSTGSGTSEGLIDGELFYDEYFVGR